MLPPDRLDELQELLLVHGARVVPDQLHAVVLRDRGDGRHSILVVELVINLKWLVSGSPLVGWYRGLGCAELVQVDDAVALLPEII